VGIAVSGDDIFSISLFGALNYWKDGKNAAEGALPTSRFHGHSNIVGCLD